MLDRAEIVARLREIEGLIALHGGNKFKARAFARGARALEASREPVAVLVDEHRLTDLPGIGASLAHQIEELHRTGRSELLDSLKRGLPSGVMELAQIPGIGLHALRLFSEQLGIATLEDLRRVAQAGRLRGLRGFGPKKEAKILAAIDAYEAHDAGRAKILLSDGLSLAGSLAGELARLRSVRAVDVAGGLRRGMEQVGEVELVVTADDPGAALDEVSRIPRASAAERRDETSCRLRLPDGTRVVVSVGTPAARGGLLVARTGARAHVEALAKRATERGIRMERLRASREEEVYRALGLSFVPPELREGEGEVAEADGGEAWEDLVTLGDLQGFTHCHSTWSDGRHTIEAMARAAEARGARFITITDHSAAAHYARGLDVERLARQCDEIDEVQERVGIRILKGTEADILADGSIDWPDRVLERLDVVIASIHARYRQDESKMTERLLRAMRAPIFKIWGHPLGRLVGSRPPIPCRVEEVLDALAEARGAIEINGDPHRLDLEPRWVRAARERGIPFVLSVDAHSMRELDNAAYATLLARRAGVRREEVLNAEPAAAFAEAVRPVNGGPRSSRSRSRRGAA